MAGSDRGALAGGVTAIVPARPALVYSTPVSGSHTSTVSGSGSTELITEG